jgi:hypothetical protein
LDASSVIIIITTTTTCVGNQRISSKNKTGVAFQETGRGKGG